MNEFCQSNELATGCEAYKAEQATDADKVKTIQVVLKEWRKHWINDIQLNIIGKIILASTKNELKDIISRETW